MRPLTLCKPWEHRLSRRQWLGSTAASAGALGMGDWLSPALAAGAKKKRKQVLFVWLDGGLSQLESWDPKPDTQFGGPFRAIATSVPGIHISELLPKTARQMHHLALVRGLCTKDNSHSAGVARIQRGDPKNRGVVYPYLGSAAARWLGSGDSGLPPYVVIKPGNGGFFYQDAGFLGPKYGALALGDGKPPENLPRHKDVSAEDDAERKRLRSQADSRYAQRRRKQAADANSHVYEMAEQLGKRKELFDSRQFAAKDVERYGSHELGRHLLQARSLLEAGVTFVKVISYGWDTHGDNFNGHYNMVGKFDGAFASLMEDLAARSMLDDVLVIVLSEFGRTPRINGHVGRDHWPEAWSCAMAGAGCKRGIVVGKTNALGTYVTSDEHDIGHMFHTWFHLLGINPSEKDYDNNGQPLPIANEACAAIGALLP